MKDTLIENKTKQNNLQRNNSRVDEAENRVNDLEHKEEKTTKQDNKKKKRIQKNEASGTTSRSPTFASQGCQ